LRRVFKARILADKIKYKKLLDVCKDADVILVTGGDNYDRSYGMFDIMHSLNRLLRKTSRAKMVMYDCSLDPEEIDDRIKKDFELFDVIAAREVITYNAFKEVFAHKELYYFPDPAFVMDKTAVPFPDSFIEGKTVGVNVSSMVVETQYGSNQIMVVDAYVNLIKTILTKTDYQVMLIPHVMRRLDLKILEILYGHFAGNDRVMLITNESYNAAELKYLISRCRLFVGARTHSTIAAYSSQVPTLVLGYSIKSVGIATDLFGTPEGYVVSTSNLKSDEDLAAAFEKLLEHEDEIREHFSTFIPDYVEKAWKTGSMLLKLSRSNENFNGMEVYSDRLKCTGCHACASKCPRSSITMVLDEEGFRYPVIDDRTCINCGQCARTCPIEKDLAYKDKLEHPVAYACYDKDDEVRNRSATGGIFFTLASRVIDNGGIVFGAVGCWLDRIYHTKAESIEDVKKMCNSKYLQSDINDTFKEAKQILNEGRPVFYTGTPCQIAGLYAYLEENNDNLFTADLICHGVPSEVAFRKYIDDLEKEKGYRVMDVYRDKSVGWRPVHFTFVYETGEKETVSGMTDIYNRGFTTNLFQRKSCYTCKYASIPRIGDITLGDYFGGDKSKRYDKENKGLSLVTVNTEKGKKMFESIKERLFLREYSIDEAVDESEHLAHPPRYNVFRKTFFKLIREKTYSQTAALFLPVRFWPRVRKKIMLEFYKITRRSDIENRKCR
jgi:coenzyme F420-reducing hydrogenase beta subunit/polysaccharide pyruvyl transferase WcaK-like protein